MSKLYIVLDSEHRMNEMGFNEGGCSVFSTYEDALQSAHKEHARPYGLTNQEGLDEDCPYYDCQILIVETIGHSVNQREVYLPKKVDFDFVMDTFVSVRAPEGTDPDDLIKEAKIRFQDVAKNTNFDVVLKEDV